MEKFNMKQFGIEPGQLVKPTKSYEDQFEESFYATVLFIKDGVAVLEKDNGDRAIISCYWLMHVKEREL